VDVVTDWKTPGTIMEEGLSCKFTVPKVRVLADEEFYDVNEGIERKAHLNPRGRLMTNDADVATEIAHRYFAGHDWVRIEA
jgi:hypothetical protein